MIWESHYWKNDLTEMAEFLEKPMPKGRWTERACVDLEKKVFIAFYSIRKLMEAKKLTDKIMNRQVPMIVHPATGKNVTLMNWHKIDELYHLDQSTSVCKSLRFICDQFIHSYVYLPIFDESEGKLQALMIASDRLRNSGLFVLFLTDFLSILREVGGCDQVSKEMIFDSSLGDYVVWSS